jgi:uncharacterized protein
VKARPKRILSLDGGGIRGVFTLQILGRIEAIFRERSGRPGLVLADEFDLIAGTSTGAIIAAMLSWGLSVADIERLYVEESSRMFIKSSWSERWKTRYTAQFITEFFQRFFSEDGRGRRPALLGTRRLRTLVLLVMRNATTGSAWPVTNNPRAEFNDPRRGDCNLKIPLWQLVRASTAAPTFFPPEQIRFGENEFIFVDGGITPYNNPALIAYLTATLPRYRIGWETGVDKLELVSVGTGHVRTRLTKQQAVSVNLLDAAMHVIPALMQSAAVEQDLLCRAIGDCSWGEPVDAEIGALTEEGDKPSPRGERKFRYVRYDHRFTPEEGAAMRSGGHSDPFALDNLALIPALRALGREFAAANVKPGHL